ncbi:hypothetical protein DSO57_1010543 [Entomophthora muscae]|uniref:Uncharacterized protein n=1 Tax=Entomophthora muscae TaxID=34485 RepID=A0ACC2SW43_9FUNG|nr:hypothetical protein DSO57_1010543 [Entomophthora muscae]
MVASDWYVSLGRFGWRSGARLQRPRRLARLLHSHRYRDCAIYSVVEVLILFVDYIKKEECWVRGEAGSSAIWASSITRRVSFLAWVSVHHKFLVVEYRCRPISGGLSGSSRRRTSVMIVDEASSLCRVIDFVKDL